MINFKIKKQLIKSFVKVNLKGSFSPISKCRLTFFLENRFAFDSVRHSSYLNNVTVIDQAVNNLLFKPNSFLKQNIADYIPIILFF